MRNLMIILGTLFLVLCVIVSSLKTVNILGFSLPAIVTDNIKFMAFVGIGMVAFGYLGTTGMIIAVILDIIILLGGGL